MSRTRFVSIIGSLAVSGVALVVLLALPPLLTRTPVVRADVDELILAEVFYDHSGSDNGYEWVEICNTTNAAIDLSNYSIGYGGVDYTYGTCQLAGTIPAYACWVVGGPNADAENGNPTYDQSQDLNPDIQNSGATADGVALFDVAATDITPTTVPIDAVIYGGSNDNNLVDETGSASPPEVGDASLGSSIERTSLEGDWQIQSNPDPNHIAFELEAPAFEIHKVASPPIVRAGDVLTYTIWVTNTGVGSTATSVAITDTLPINTTWIRGGNYANGVVSFTTPSTIGVNGVISVTFAVIVQAPYGSPVVNESYGVYCAEVPTPTMGGAVTTTVSAIDLIAGKSGPQYAVIDENVVYTITLQSQGVISAANVVLTDTLPVSTTYVSDDSGVICPACSLGASGVITWAMGDVLSETSTSFNLTVTLDVNVTSGTVLTNKVQVSTETAGDNPANNMVQWETTAYPLVAVEDIQKVPDPAADDGSPLEGEIVWVEGIVTSEPGDIDSPSRMFVIEDSAGGAWSGLPVFKGSAFPGLSAPGGTAVRLLGRVDEYYGLTQLRVDGSPAAVETLSTGNPVPGPNVVATTAFDDSDPARSEQWEGVLIEFQDATVTNDNLGYGEWSFDDGSGPARADDLGGSDGDLTYEPSAGDSYIFIRGIGWYSFDNYKLEPRDDADVRLRPTVPTLTKHAPSRVAPGELLTYTLAVTNELGITLNNVVITDLVPAKTTFAYALDSGVEDNGVVSWTIPSLPDLTDVTVRFAITATNSSAVILNDDYAVIASNFITPTAGAPVGTIVSTDTLRVRDIQGAGHLSPLNGQQVQDIHGIVTLVAGNGFYMQDPDPDQDVATSEGLFVFGNAPGVTVGDEVLVSGTVAEFYNAGSEGLSTTRIDLSGTPTVSSTGNLLPTPIVIGAGGRVPPTEVIDDDADGGSVETSGTFDAETDGIDFYESLEGMLVQINDAIAVGPTEGEVIPVVGDNGAHATFMAERNGITAGIVIREGDFNPERLAVANFGLPAPPEVDVGDRFPGAITGTIDYDDVQTTGNFYLVNANPLNATVGGLVSESTSLTSTEDALTVASFNVYNLDPTDTAEKFNDLASQVVNNIGAPDIVGLEEVQDNNGTIDDGTVDASLTWTTLITAIQDVGGPVYEYLDIAPENNQDGGAPGGNIRVGLLFRPDRVTLVQRGTATATTATSPTLGASGVELTFSPGRVDPTNPAVAESRKSLAAEFIFNEQKLFLIANHFNSKSGDAPLFGNIQPPVFGSEVQRLGIAQLINGFADSILALDSNANVIVLGDLNDFQFSAAVSDTLAADVLTNLVNTVPVTDQYTYNFEGNSEVLDHILVSRHLRDGAAPEFDIVHVNTEFVDNIGSSSRRPSDHDPVVARFWLPHRIYLPLVMRSG
jgi:uncharacterized repeat protein (TIGR01451 family)